MTLAAAQPLALITEAAVSLRAAPASCPTR